MYKRGAFPSQFNVQSGYKTKSSLDDTAFSSKSGQVSKNVSRAKSSSNAFRKKYSYNSEAMQMNAHARIVNGTVDGIVEVNTPNSRSRDGARNDSFDEYDHKKRDKLIEKRLRVQSTNIMQRKDELAKKAASNRKLNLAAMQQIASKLMVQMQPGQHVSKGQLPILSIAQIEKAMNNRRKKLKIATSKNYALLTKKPTSKQQKDENQSRGAGLMQKSKNRLFFSSVGSQEANDQSIESKKLDTTVKDTEYETEKASKVDLVDCKKQDYALIESSKDLHQSVR